MSYIERTARKLYPILTTLKKRMIKEKKPNLSPQKMVDYDDSDSDNQNMVIDLRNDK